MKVSVLRLRPSEPLEQVQPATTIVSLLVVHEGPVNSRVQRSAFWKTDGPITRWGPWGTVT